ncbi:MAG: hypothetical protein JWM28_1228 [Chitinophagaceae bacterium]|nr:hypothetical protein [Chitinophagaceae bacterium]
MSRFYLILCLFFFTENLFAQVANDSTKPAVSDTSVIIQTQDVSQNDSLVNPPVNNDTMLFKPAMDSAWKTRCNPYLGKSFLEMVYKDHPFFAFDSTPFRANSEIKQFKGKEPLFYVLIALFLLFAFLKTIFPKYLNDLFRLFFRRTLKQRQITEQLSQTPLPSLVFNAFFIITGGLYIAFILQHFNVGNQSSFWLLSLYSSAALGVIYVIKFLGLKFTGWILNLPGATESYIFIVFIINKIIGIFLLPFLILIAFAQGELYQLSITLSSWGIAGLLVYRFILSYSAVHNQIKVKPFHFIIYLLAFEIVPLLLIYKLLLYFLF